MPGGFPGPLLFLLLLFAPVQSIIENSLIEIDSGVSISALRNIDHPFGFLAGGTYWLDISKITPPLNETQLYVFYDSKDGRGLDPVEMCANVTQNGGLNVSNFYFFEQILEDPFHLNGTITVKGYYTLLFLFCSNGTTQFQLFFETTNPPGTNLSFAQIFLPHAFLALALSWAILLLFMAANWLRHRQETTQLFSFMIFLFSMKFLLVATEVFVWFWKAEKGSIFVGVLLFEFLSDYLFWSLFFYFVLAVGRGWCIICPVVKKSTHQKILTASLGLSGLLLVYDIFRSYSVIVVCLGFIFYVCAFILCARLVINHLERQITFAQSERLLEVLIPGMRRKLRLVLAYQKLVVAFCLVFPTWLVLVNVFFPNDEWVGSIGMESITAAMCLFLARLFHLQNFQQYHNNAIDIHKDVEDLLRSRRPKYICIEFPHSQNPRKSRTLFDWNLSIQMGMDDRLGSQGLIYLHQVG